MSNTGTSDSAVVVAFWDGIEENMRLQCDRHLPLELLEDRLNAGAETPTLQAKYYLLESLAREEAERRRATDPGSLTGVLHTLAMLENQQDKSLAAEATWRELLHNNDPNRPNLAALYNLSTTLDELKKHAEAEALMRAVTELVRIHLGETSQQYIGILRALGSCVGAQGRVEEARRILELARKQANALKDQDQEAGAEHASAIDKVEADLGQRSVL